MLREYLSPLWEILKIILLALLIVMPIRYFLFQPFIVKGQSMEPGFSSGDYLIIDEITYRFREPLRGEVIVFKYPLNLSHRYIKRIIGLPGERVEIKNGKVYINGNLLNESAYLPLGTETPGKIEVVLGENEYFVLGDNRIASADSRSWGPLPRQNIIGRAIIRAWPLDALAKFTTPLYPF